MIYLQFKIQQTFAINYTENMGVSLAKTIVRLATYILYYPFWFTLDLKKMKLEGVYDWHSPDFDAVIALSL